MSDEHGVDPTGELSRNVAALRDPAVKQHRLFENHGADSSSCRISILQERTTEILTCSLSESMCTSTRLQGVDTFLERSSWI